MLEKLQKEIEKIVKSLKSYNPEKIILFGSAVDGKMRENSDIDILIVKQTDESPYKRYTKAAKLLYTPEQIGKNYFSFPIDLRVYTPKEIKYRSNLGDFFIQEILEKGKIVYEK